MAQNVDLMVVGTSDGASATELTQRLVVEFGQPAEAFTDLVAAACGSGGSYAAQTKVSLDTAVEGQMQLEKLGVVCNVLMDGEVMGGTPVKPPNESALIEEPAESEISSAVEGIDQQPDVSAEAEVEVSAVVDPPLETDVPVAGLPIEAETTESKPDTTSEESSEANDQLPVTNGLEVTNVSFGDELDLLGRGPSMSADTSGESGELEEHLPAENGLEVTDISFNDELGSLDDEVEKTRDKIKIEQEHEKEKAVKVAHTASKPEIRKTEAADIAEADDGLTVDDSSDELSAELNFEIEDEPQVAKSHSETDAEPAPELKAGEDLELSLSVDDSSPLTKPKPKTGKAPDDGGLTLSLDNDTPLTTKKESTKPKPEALDATLSLDNEPSPAAKKLPPVDETDVKPAEPEISIASEPVTEIPSEVVAETAPVAEARDTSRELKEDVAPLLDEPEPKLPASPNKDEGTQAPPQDSEIDKAGSDQSADNIAAELTSGSVVEAPVIASKPGANALDSLIDDLASGAGGLVLPGQTATEDVPAVVDAPPVTHQADGSADLQHSLQSQLQSAEALDSIVDNSNGTKDDHREEVSIVFEDDEIKVKRAKLIKTAVAASVMVGVLGGGAAFYLTGGLGGKAVVPVVATIAPVNENSALDAVEEGSLNAAIKRSTDISNPDDYSTEELIVYLADDLGVNARKELQNYVNGDGEYEVAPLPVPRMGAAIPADSNSVLWLKNRVDHSADKHFDEWSKREVDLQAYMELQERLIEVGDLEIARDVSSTTKDNLFAVMSLQRLARSYNELGHSDKAMEVLQLATRGIYSIESEAERTIAIADYAMTEKEMGLTEDALDSFLKASILARSLSNPESKTVALSAIAEYYQRVGRDKDMAEYLDLAMTTAYELPVNTAARDLAIRHVALTEVRLGLTAQATDHANLIVDPFAAVSALHGIALELERTGDQTNARLTLNMAYRAGSLIKNGEKREKLLEKIKLAGG